MAGEAGSAAEILARLRASRPLVHLMTNFVTASDSANAVLCAGGLPVAAMALAEAAEMAAQAGALVLNTGTPNPARLRAMVAAGRQANESGVPVVLDPVGVGATSFRAALVRELLDSVAFAVVRGNRGEIASLAGQGGAVVGVAADRDIAIADEVATRVAQAEATTVAATGARDIVSDGGRTAIVSNGHPALEMVAGTGCMATSVVACFVAAEQDTLLATVSALAAFGLAGERAASRATGPGSLKVALLDELATLSPAALGDGARIEWARN